MQARLVLKKGLFFIFSFLLLIFLFLGTYLYSLVSYTFLAPVVLANEKMLYVFAKAVILFSDLWLPTYFSFLIFYFSIYFAYLKKDLLAKSVASVLLITIAFSLLEIPIKEIIRPAYEYKKISFEFEYRYAVHFYNGGVVAFQNPLKSIDDSDLNDRQKLELYNSFEKGVNRFERYLFLDSEALFDRDILVNNRNVGSGDSLLTKRALGNKVGVREMIRYMKARMNILLFENQALFNLEHRNNWVVLNKYNQIEEAALLLDAGQKESNLEKVVEAYAIYHSNSLKYPGDLEFIEGVKSSKSAISRLSFVRDDILPFFELPVVEDLLILQDSLDGIREEISASSLIISHFTCYFKDVSIRGYDINSGSLLYTVKSKYASVVGQKLFFANISSDLSKDSIMMGKKTFSNGKSFDIAYIPFRVSKSLIPNLSRSAKWMGEFNLSRIFALMNYFKDKDPRRSLLQVEFVLRLFEFSFFLLAPIFILLVALRRRPRYESSPYWLIIFFPFVLFNIYMFYKILLYYMRLFIGFLLYAFSFKIGLIVLAGLFITFLIFLLTFVAIRRNRESF